MKHEDGYALQNDLRDGWEFLRAQIGLLASLVIMIGVTTTEAYYGYFGLRYQALELPLYHIAFRGISTLFYDIELLIPYLIAVAALFINPFQVVAIFNWFVHARILIFMILAVLLPLTYFLSSNAGTEVAIEQSRSQSTELPRMKEYVVRNSNAEIQIIKTTGLRVVGTNSDFVILIRPVEDKEGVPETTFLSKSKILEYSLAK